MVSEEKEKDISPIQESFLEEQLFQVNTSNLPWLADNVSFLVRQVF